MPPVGVAEAGGSGVADVPLEVVPICGKVERSVLEIRKASEAVRMLPEDVNVGAPGTPVKNFSPVSKRVEAASYGTYGSADEDAVRRCDAGRQRDDMAGAGRWRARLSRNAALDNRKGH
jgi:hypothetical protein